MGGDEGGDEPGPDGVQGAVAEEGIDGAADGLDETRERPRVEEAAEAAGGGRQGHADRAVAGRKQLCHHL